MVKMLFNMIEGTMTTIKKGIKIPYNYTTHFKLISLITLAGYTLNSYDDVGFVVDVDGFLKTVKSSDDNNVFLHYGEGISSADRKALKTLLEEDKVLILSENLSFGITRDEPHNPLRPDLDEDMELFPEYHTLHVSSLGGLSTIDNHEEDKFIVLLDFDEIENFLGERVSVKGEVDSFKIGYTPVSVFVCENCSDFI